MNKVYILVYAYYVGSKSYVDAVPYNEKDMAILEMTKMFNRAYDKSIHTIKTNTDEHIVIEGSNGLDLLLELTIIESDVK